MKQPPAKTVAELQSSVYFRW